MGINAIRVHKVDKTYGGNDFLYISFNQKLVIKGNTRSCKNTCDRLSMLQSFEISTLKELKERLRVLKLHGFKVHEVNDLEYDEIKQILNRDDQTL